MSDQNEMKANENQKDENQEQEVGILAVEPCCDNGCILTDAANGCSVAEGNNTTASGFASHAEGANTIASGFASHAEGQDITIDGLFLQTQAIGNASHAEGQGTRANGEASHAEGRFSTTGALAAHAEGFNNGALGFASHAEGSFSNASGSASHAEGTNTLASGSVSHTEGLSTTASLTASHAEGFGTTSSGIASHAEGTFTTASGEASHAEGENTNTAGFTGAHIMGKFGDANEAYSWFLANGTSAVDKGLAAKILTTGIAFNDRGWRGGGADYAEMFETVDGKSIDVGYFVTLEGDKIRKANENDDYILGVISTDPAFVADIGEMRWKNKYLKDKWGRIQYHDVIIPEKKNKEGNIIIPERTETQPILNPDCDNTKEYVPRSKRSEWVAVGLLGKLLVRDDGTCQVNGYCRPNDEGIATAFDKGYRVMKRTGSNQILVLFNGNRIT
ncbi:MAG: peptidase G2 autoproteolytic cleavage domain-containing protein [Bacillota bacterium]